MASGVCDLSSGEEDLREENQEQQSEMREESAERRVSVMVFATTHVLFSAARNLAQERADRSLNSGSSRFEVSRLR